MEQGMRRHSPAMAIAILALFVALGGSVYAAKRAKIDGRAIRAKSIPGNRLKPRSVPANRLKPHSIAAGLLQPGVIPQVAADAPLTGADINELTLGQVPSAAHADSADTAQSAVDAQTALNAVNAVDAQTVNGHSVGCLPGTVQFAGACWESSPSSAVNAPTAARKCATRGGELPAALELAAFAEEPGVSLDVGDEWSGDISIFTGLNTYGVATVTTDSEIDSGLSTETHAYRCVIPLVT
ncbi:MAG TPA: hypothetical protein VFN89_06145 [Solirubrobacterales bacterium]|nr:hypothetical protein [Solirubrobacterales bacterium]